MKDLINKIKKDRTESDFKKFLSMLEKNQQSIGKYYLNYRQKIKGSTVNTLMGILYEREKVCSVYISDICLYYKGTKITEKYVIEILIEYYKLDGYLIQIR